MVLYGTAVRLSKKYTLRSFPHVAKEFVPAEPSASFQRQHLSTPDEKSS